MAAKSISETSTPEDVLEYLIDTYGPKDKKFIRSVLAAVRKRVPTANELLYEYNGFFVIAYSPTDHPINGILSVAGRDDGLSLYFTHGKQLPDPNKLLKGSANVRFIKLESASRVTDPEVEALIAAEIALASVPLPADGKGRLIIRSVGKKKAAAKKKPANKSAAKKNALKKKATGKKRSAKR